MRLLRHRRFAHAHALHHCPSEMLPLLETTTENYDLRNQLVVWHHHFYGSHQRHQFVRDPRTSRIASVHRYRNPEGRQHSDRLPLEIELKCSRRALRGALPDGDAEMLQLDRDCRQRLEFQSIELVEDSPATTR